MRTGSGSTIVMWIVAAVILIGIFSWAVARIINMG